MVICGIGQENGRAGERLRWPEFDRSANRYGVDFPRMSDSSAGMGRARHPARSSFSIKPGRADADDDVPTTAVAKMSARSACVSVS
jgi:hypothetical protein